MILSVVPALVIKFLVWALALMVFLRTLAQSWQPQDGAARRIGAVLLFGAVAGAKLVFLLNYPAVTLAVLDGDTKALLMLAGAGSAPGALLGGALALWLQNRRGASAAFTLDMLVVPTASALCVLNCGAALWALSEPGFGLPTSVPWGIDFGDGIARHPVMLYEAAFLLLVVWMHDRLAGGEFAPGERAMLFVAAYCGLRVLFDYYRPPFGAPFLTELMHPHPWIYGRIMTGEQWVCVFAVLALLPAWWKMLRRLLAALARD